MAGMKKAIEAWHKRCNPLTSEALRELDQRSAAATFSGHRIPGYDRGRRDAYLDVSDHIPHREHKLTGHERDWILARANRFAMNGTEYGHGRSDGYIDTLRHLTMQNPIDPVSGAGFVAGQVIVNRMMGNPLGSGAKVRLRGLVAEMKSRATRAQKRGNLGLANWYRGQLAAYAAMSASDGFSRPLLSPMQKRLRHRNPAFRIGEPVRIKSTGEEVTIKSVQEGPRGLLTTSDTWYSFERGGKTEQLREGQLASL